MSNSLSSSSECATSLAGRRRVAATGPSRINIERPMSPTKKSLSSRARRARRLEHGRGAFAHERGALAHRRRALAQARRARSRARRARSRARRFRSRPRRARLTAEVRSLNERAGEPSRQQLTAHHSPFLPPMLRFTQKLLPPINDATMHITISPTVAFGTPLPDPPPPANGNLTPVPPEEALSKPPCTNQYSPSPSPPPPLGGTFVRDTQAPLTPAASISICNVNASPCHLITAHGNLGKKTHPFTANMENMQLYKRPYTNFVRAKLF
jgi:hypothetical protein